MKVEYQRIDSAVKLGHCAKKVIRAAKHTFSPTLRVAVGLSQYGSLKDLNTARPNPAFPKGLGLTCRSTLVCLLWVQDDPNKVKQ